MNEAARSPHVFPVTIYYEDTDFTGMVYHANYLKFFERAREEMLGIDALRALYSDHGLGFVVHEVQIRFKAPAVHGDRLQIRSTAQRQSEYRLVFRQEAFRGDARHPLVSADIHLVCVGPDRKLHPLPTDALCAAGLTLDAAEEKMRAPG